MYIALLHLDMFICVVFAAMQCTNGFKKNAYKPTVLINIDIILKPYIYYYIAPRYYFVLVFLCNVIDQFGLKALDKRIAGSYAG